MYQVVGLISPTDVYAQETMYGEEKGGSGRKKVETRQREEEKGEER